MDGPPMQSKPVWGVKSKLRKKIGAIVFLHLMTMLIKILGFKIPPEVLKTSPVFTFYFVKQ